LPHDFFWFSEERLLRDTPSYIPSWSWASTTGPISFKLSVFENPRPFKVQIETSPHDLTIIGVLRQVENLEGPVQCQALCFEDLQDMGFTGRIHDDYVSGSIRVSPTYMFYFGGQKLGWGVFDEHDKPKRPVFCLPLLKQKVWAGFVQTKEQYFLWVLLLYPVEHDNIDLFERVGWGLPFVPSWFNGMAMQNISLM